MGEHEFKLDSGYLYFIEPDESASLLDHVTDTSVEYGTDLNDISTPIGSLGVLEASFECVAKMTRDAMLAITGAYQAIINCCPDKRVVYLALHDKTARIRKKNRNRAIRILEELP